MDKRTGRTRAGRIRKACTRKNELTKTQKTQKTQKTRKIEAMVTRGLGQSAGPEDPRTKAGSGREPNQMAQDSEDHKHQNQEDQEKPTPGESKPR
ncbi:hypothetical protein NDU88_006133 [Pleurodeles waltl]|uniref:Uncharacterized protein n=1 Tax=Pleurodeles waltl TaxID=8319 RepID=A0AAV7TDX7_PLEWA|nr:hypothetical protein NDU88_006133 [Pleurodeles waltl]